MVYCCERNVEKSPTVYCYDVKNKLLQELYKVYSGK